MRTLLIIISLLLLHVFCLNGQSFELVWETKQVLKTPESVYFDAERNQIYVSNINGKPTDKDGNGFISLIDVEGNIKALKWYSGMNAPKGMTMVENKLYVTDIDRFHIIDLEQNKIVKTIPVEGAQFLNDMAADETGVVYISDMSNNHILRFDGEKVEVWSDDELLQQPNGLVFFKGNLFIGTKNALIKSDLEGAKLKILIEETGPIDGLIPLGNNKFVVSDWSGRIMIISPLEKIVLGNTSEQNIQAADLGYMPGSKTVLIPTFFDNRVVARSIQ